MKDCIFCKLMNREIPTEVIYEDEKCFAFRDINPQAPQHILIIPKKHIPSLNEIKDESEEVLGHLLKVIPLIAEKLGLTEKGYRIVINCGKSAGQEVFHLHIHLLGGRKFSWPPG